MHAQSDNLIPEALEGTNMGMLFESMLQIAPSLILIGAITFAVPVAFRAIKSLIAYSPSSYTSSEAMRQLPKSSSPMYQRQMTATRNGASITLRVPTGCQCALCNPHAQQKELVAGMLAAPPLHEWRGWSEYADR